MQRAFELGSWASADELCDRLHDHFMSSGLVDWLQIAERADVLREHYSLLFRPVLYAACAQAWEGALTDFATRAHVHADALLQLMRDVRDETAADFPVRLLEIIAHGPAQCDHAECRVCGEGARP